MSIENIFNAPESGKKNDVNGGRKLSRDLTFQQREARIARLAEFYSTPRLGDPSPFGDTGLALTPRKGEDLGPALAKPEEVPAEDQGDENAAFVVTRTPAWDDLVSAEVTQADIDAIFREFD